MDGVIHARARAWLHEGRMTLNHQEQAALDSHLAGCAECQSYSSYLTTMEPVLTRALHVRWDSVRLPAHPEWDHLHLPAQAARPARGQWATLLLAVMVTLLAVIVLAGPSVAEHLGIVAIPTATLPAPTAQLSTVVRGVTATAAHTTFRPWLGYVPGAHSTPGLRAALQAVAKDLGWTFQSTRDFVDAQTSMQDMSGLAAQGVDVVVVDGADLADVTRAMASTFAPHTNFIGVGQAATGTSLPNLLTLGAGPARQDQLGFMDGVVAGYATRTKVLTAVGDTTSPTGLKYRNGFLNGVLLSCADCRVDFVDLTNPNDGAAVAEQVRLATVSGSDVVFAAAGPASPAILQAATGAGGWVLGADADVYQSVFAGGAVAGADRVLTSAYFDPVAAVIAALQAYKAGVPWGGARPYAAATGALVLAPVRVSTTVLSDRDRSQIQATLAQLADGSLDTGVDPLTGLSLAVRRGTPTVTPLPSTSQTTATSVTPVLPATPSGLIAFVSRRDSNNDEVYVMRADGSHAVNLSNDPGRDDSPAWSPDGQQLAFISNRAGRSAVYLVRPDGSDLHQLVLPPSGADLGDVTGVAWSPDGTRLALTRRPTGQLNDQNDFVQLVALNGKSTLFLGSASQPQWSPDGSQLAFIHNDGQGFPALYVARGYGTEAAMVVSSTALLSGTRELLFDFAWSPDSAHLAYTTAGPYHGDSAHLALDSPPSYQRIYSIRPDGSGRQLVVNFEPVPDGLRGPNWSPDDRYLLYSLGNSSGGCFTLHLVEIAIGTDTAFQGVCHEPRTTVPSWSPDSRFLVFTAETSWPGKPAGVILLDVAEALRHPAGFQVLQLAGSPEAAGSAPLDLDPVWQPTGR